MSYNTGRTENNSQISYNLGAPPPSPPSRQERPQEIWQTNPFDNTFISASQQETIACVSRSNIWRQFPPPPKGSTAQVTTEEGRTLVLSNFSPPRWTNEENQALLATVSQIKQQRGGTLKHAFKAFHNTHPHRTEAAIERQYEKLMPRQQARRWTDPENQELLATVLQVQQQQGGNVKHTVEAFHNTHPHRTKAAIYGQYAKLMQRRNILSLRTPPPPLYINQSISLAPTVSSMEGEFLHEIENKGDESGDSIPLQQSVSTVQRLSDQEGWSKSMIGTSNAPQKRKRGDDPDDEEWGKQSSSTRTLSVQTFAPTERTRNQESEKSTNPHLLPHMSWEKLQECFLSYNKAHFEQILSLVGLPLQVVQNIFLKECKILLQDLMNLKKNKGTSTSTQNPTADDLQSIMGKARQQILDRIGRTSQQMVGSRHIEGNANTQTTTAKQISVHPTNLMTPQNRAVPQTYRSVTIHPTNLMNPQNRTILQNYSSVTIHPTNLTDPQNQTVSQDYRSLYEDSNERATEEGRTLVLSNFSPSRWPDEEKRESRATVSQVKQQRRGTVKRAFEAFHNAHPHSTEVATHRQYEKLMQRQNILSLRTPPPLLYREDNSGMIRRIITESVQSMPLAPTVSSMEGEFLHEIENQGNESGEGIPSQMDSTAQRWSDQQEGW